MGRVALRPLYASRDLRRTVVIDETLPAICQQRRPALPRREGGRGRLREALRAQALRVRVVRVLAAVLRGCPG